MIPALAKDLLQSKAIAHLSTIDPDGRPHVTCAWVGLEGDEIVLGTLFDQRKLRNLRRDPRATLSLQSESTNPMGLREYLVVSGRQRLPKGERQSF